MDGERREQNTPDINESGEIDTKTALTSTEQEVPKEPVESNGEDELQDFTDPIPCSSKDGGKVATQNNDEETDKVDEEEEEEETEKNKSLVAASSSSSESMKTCETGAESPKNEEEYASSSSPRPSTSKGFKSDGSGRGVGCKAKSESHFRRRNYRKRTSDEKKSENSDRSSEGILAKERKKKSSEKAEKDNPDNGEESSSSSIAAGTSKRTRVASSSSSSSEDEIPERRDGNRDEEEISALDNATRAHEDSSTSTATSPSNSSTGSNSSLPTSSSDDMEEERNSNLEEPDPPTVARNRRETDDERRNRRRRMRLMRLLNDIGEDSDEDRMSAHEDEDHADDDAAADTEAEEYTDPPCPYNVVQDLCQRELGLKHRKKDGRRRLRRDWFARHRMGSLGLTARLEIDHKLSYHQGCVNSLHFNASGTYLASGSDDLDVAVWDWRWKKKPAFAFSTGHKANVFQSKFLAFAGDTHIVTASRDGQIRLAELNMITGECRSTKKLVEHRGPAHKLSLLSPFTPHTFLSGGEDGVVYSVDVREQKAGTKVLTQRPSSGSITRGVPIYSIDVNKADDNYFCTSGRDRYVRIYDRRKAPADGASDATDEGALKKLCPDKLVSSDMGSTVTCAVFSYDGREVVASYSDDDIYLFDAVHSDGADSIRSYTGHRNNATVKGVNFYGAQSEFVVSGSDCGNVFFWSKDTGKLVHLEHGDDSGVVNVLEPHPSFPILATSGLDDDVKIWFPKANKAEQQPKAERKKINKIVRKNIKERERSVESYPFDGQMLWEMFRNHRRNQERRQRNVRNAGTAEDGEEPPPRSQEVDNNDGNVSDGSSSDGDGRFQCHTS